MRLKWRFVGTKKLDEILPGNISHILAENRRVTEVVVSGIREQNKTMLLLLEKLLRVDAVDHDYKDLVAKTIKEVKEGVWKS